jgi:hypothetical protein
MTNSSKVELWSAGEHNGLNLAKETTSRSPNYMGADEGAMAFHHAGLKGEM